MKTTFARSTFFVALFLLNMVFLFGQDYKTVHFDREAYFESEEFDISSDGSEWSFCQPCRFGIRVDSLLSTDSTYVFPKYWEELTGDFIPRASWLGDTLQILSDGSEVFYNKVNEPILLKPQAALQDKWNIFSITPDLFLEGEVTDISYQDVLGHMDSVKTITIQAKSFSGMNMDHLLNETTIQIAQNFGFTKTLDFFHFPNQNLSKDLIGLSNPTIGEELLNTRNIFDFEVGDEMHFYESHTYEVDTYTRRLIIGKEEVNPDSVIYQIETWAVELWGYYDYDANVFSNGVNEEKDTIFQSYDLAGYNTYTIHPYEIDPIFGDAYYSFIAKDNKGWFRQRTGGPVSLSISWYYIYHVGLGRTKGHLNEFGDLKFHEELIYYKKNNIEWGTPINFIAITSSKEIQNPKSSIIIYPNPAKNNITISSEDSNQKLQHVQVLNALGQKVADWPCENESELTKSISVFSTGMYWLVISDKEDNVWRLNFVKE